MNRTRPQRALSALVALVFLLIRAGDLFALHPCPHHDLAGMGAHHDAAMMAGAAAHHEPPAHDCSRPSASSASRDHGNPSPDGDHSGCTCMGACPAVSVPALPIPSRLIVAAEVVTTIQDGIADPDSLLPPLPAFFLPYAQAPPLGA